MRFPCVCLLAFAAIAAARPQGERTAERPQQERKKQTIDACAVACLYYLVLTREPSQTLEHVKSTIIQRFPDANLQALSLHEIVESSKLLGTPLHPVQCDSHSIREISLPALVYARHERLGKQPGDIGHLSILTNMSDDGAEIYDPLYDVAATYSWSDLWDSFDGEILTTSDFRKRRVMANIAWGLSLLSVLIGACLLLRRWRGGIRSTRIAPIHRRTLLLAVALTSLLLGCESRRGTIAFDTVEYDCGEVDAANDIFAEYAFTVEAKPGLTIKCIDRSCGCIRLLGADFVGRRLHCGERRVFWANVEGPELVGPYDGRLAVQTDVGEPILLRFYGLIRTTPFSIVSEPPVCASSFIDEEAPMVIQFSRIRLNKIPNLEFDENRSTLHGCRVIDHRIGSSMVPESGIQTESATRESHTIELSMPASRQYSVVQKNELTFAFRSKVERGEGEDFVVRVPVIRQVKHPLQLAQRTLFLGYLPPHAAIDEAVEPESPAVFRRHFGVAVCGAPFLRVQFDRDTGLLRLRGNAPEAGGRFSTVVVLKSAPDSPYAAYEWKLPVSGIVEN